MSFPSYQHYKDSGVEWLGDIPETWKVVPIKHIGRLKGGAGFPHDKQGNGGAELSFHKVSALAQADRHGVLQPSENTVSYATARELGAFVFPGHTLVFAKVGAALLLGRIRWLDREACIDNNMMGLVVSGNTFYVGYVMYAMQLVRFDLLANPGAVPSLSEGQIGEFALAIPPVREQRLISTFLDRETMKTDELIAEQWRLIGVLKEKRQAIMSHAVTKGLNAYAPMKASGVEWLSDVPSHWQVTKVKWIATMQSGHTPDKKIDAYWEHGEIPWVSLNDTGYLKDNDYISDTAYSVNQLGIDNSSARLLPPRVVVFSRDATIGRCAITTKPMAVSQHFIAWICGDLIVPEFLLLRFRSMTQELERLATGATLKTIGMPDVRTIVTPLPPLEEQRAIVDYVRSQTAELDALVAETQRAISLLQERRIASISAAVTGQIDVRGLVEPIAA